MENCSPLQPAPSGPWRNYNKQNESDFDKIIITIVFCHTILPRFLSKLQNWSLLSQIYITSTLLIKLCNYHTFFPPNCLICDFAFHLPIINFRPLILKRWSLSAEMSVRRSWNLYGFLFIYFFGLEEEWVAERQISPPSFLFKGQQPLLQKVDQSFKLLDKIRRGSEDSRRRRGEFKNRFAMTKCRDSICRGEWKLL